MSYHKGKNARCRLASTGAGLVAFIVGVAGCDIYFGSGDWVDTPAPDAAFPDSGTCTDVSGDGPIGPPFPLELGPTVQASVPPPAISGGTLALTPDETRVVVADPDRDQVHIVDLGAAAVTASIALNRGDEPGRVIVDNGGRAHVALRRGGAVVTIDLSQRALIGRPTVCAAPRGLAFDEVSGNVFVACNGGELIAMDPATGLVVSKQKLEIGLRDVVVDAEHIYVSKFRTAEVLVLNRQGQEIERMKPPGLDTFVFDESDDNLPAHFEPAVAWRMRPGPSGGVVLLHQRGRRGPVSPGQGGYGGDPCRGGVVHAAITHLRPGATPIATPALGAAVLPVDFALTGIDNQAVLVAAGNRPNSSSLFFSPVFRVRADERPDQPGECFLGAGEFDAWDNEPTAVVVTTSQTTVIQSREPAQLSIYRDGSTFLPEVVSLSNVSRADTGHTMFHMSASPSIACASCHPEGGDDARVWEFKCIGPRRTQTLQFGLLGTEPFHWDGDMASFDTLMSEVFIGRMGGGMPTAEQTAVMASWLDTLQAPPRSAPANTAAVERGRQLFQDSTVGCQACHAGPKLISNRSVDVGTGGTFQVPSLINIADRAPFIHTGCAPTLRDRFTDPSCGGGDSHGVVSHLSSEQIDDLIAYLETL
jgi:mono/diheme cytochrome c family protein